VYDGVCDLNGHPTAEEIFGTVRREVPRISLATVYKALDSLVVAGLVQKVVTDGSARYEARCDEHYHARCTQCGDVHDIDATSDLKRQLSSVPLNGFRAERAVIEFRGVCDHCTPS